MRISVAAAEVQTLKHDGRPWDGPGGARVPKPDLAAFFALDLGQQLDRLVETGEPPNPPDVFVRIIAVDGARGELCFESETVESFDPTWEPDPAHAATVEPGAKLRIEVWDHDLMLHDLIGRVEVTAPPRASGEPWALPPFGQVRRLVLRVE